MPEKYFRCAVCDTCKHYLGGGQCRINLERECAEGEYEAWECASSDKEPIVIDLREANEWIRGF